MQQADDVFYTEAKAMSIHRTEPERALAMIDSAVIVGNITRQRGEYLKAVTLYGGVHNLPLARQTCLDMLEQNDTPMDTVTLESTYLLLAGIEYTAGNYPAIIRYATEASRLAHALGKPDEVGKAEGLIAQSMAQTGRTDEGIERLRTTTHYLLQMDDFRGITALHDVTKKMGRILLDNKRFDEMVAVFDIALQRINELESHPDRFSGMKPGFDPTEFVDFARGQTLAYLTIAYALKGDLAKARETEAAVFRTRWSQSIDCDKLMSAAYHRMGEFDRFEKAMSRFEHTYADTINPNYVICLEQRSEAARLQGRYAESLDYLGRAYVIRDSLDRRNQRDQLAELATVYHLQEEQLARQEAEADARFYRWLTAVIVAALLAAIAFAVFFFRKRRDTARKNRALAREIAEAIAYKDKYETLAKQISSDEMQMESEGPEQPDSNTDVQSAALSDAGLFQFLSSAILRDRLYLDPQLDRQQLVNRFGLSKERIGAAFAKGSRYKSLIDFLNDCRLPHAAKLLGQRPEISVADIAHESGFANTDTFSRNFRQKYALTPSQYRSQHNAQP